MQQPIPPSGEQWTIRHGGQELVVVEVGGGIRSYTCDGHDVLHGYPREEQAAGGRGQLLMPWPNRLGDGHYRFGGKDLQLALSEPARHNAMHGLVRWAIWSVVEQAGVVEPARVVEQDGIVEPAGDRLTVAVRLRPQQGWAWCLDLSVTYSLGDDGLTVTPHARNVGGTPAPFGFGAHPYLTLGEDRVDELELTVPADTYLTVDPDRLLPTGAEPVSGTGQDFREGRLVGEARLDTTFTGLALGDQDRWRVVVRHPDTGRSRTLWGEAAYRWAQVFTGDSLPPDLRRTSGMAVEPMTCPPDALRSGDGVVVIAPGEEFAASWGISPG